MSQSEERLQIVIETLPVGLWLLDQNGQILQGNNEARRIWGGCRCVGIEQYGEYKGWWPTTGERIQPDQWAAARAIRTGETSLNEEIEIESFDGVRKVILNSAVPIRNALGEIVGAVVVNQDITQTKAAQAMLSSEKLLTERKQAEEERLRLDLRLRQAQKVESLGRMAGAIAHHFNNLLAAVMGNIELATSDLPEGAPALASLAQAMKASKRMAEVSGLMLAYVGHSLGKREPVDLSEILREYLPPAAAALPPKVRMNIELPARGPLVLANAVQIKQVLSNMLENAREAISDREGEITIGLTVVAASDIGPARFSCRSCHRKS